MQAMQSDVYHAGVALDLMDMNLATPLNGKLDKEKIDDAIWLGVYCGQLRPMNETDSKAIIELLEVLVDGIDGLGQSWKGLKS